MRGSIPAPGPATSKYGGNTPCVEMRCGDEQLIFDLGTGARALGEATSGPSRATILLSHYHYDHLQGLPFFQPIFDPQNVLDIYGPTRNGHTVERIIVDQMRQPFFPVSSEEVFRAQIRYQGFEAGQTLRVGQAEISTIELNHPGGNLGYRVRYGGRSVVYATDVEYGTERDEPFARFAQGADMLIYDAMYTEDEYLGRHGPAKTGWGHSTWRHALRAADQSKAKRLVLFHHEPTRDDVSLARLERQAQRLRPGTIAARESQTLFV